MMPSSMVRSGCCIRILPGETGVRMGRKAIATGLQVALMASAVSVVLPSRSFGETLFEALALAYRNNPDLEAARARLRATDELVPQALSGYRPKLFVDGDTGRTQGQSEIGDLDNTSSGVSLSITENLYAGGETTAAVNRSEATVQAERSRLRQTEQEVLLQVVDAYTAVYRDRRVLEIAINNAERLMQHLKATKDRFQVGEVARTDVAQARARHARALADVETARSNLAASLAEYRRVVGKEPGELEQVDRAAKLPGTLEEAYALSRSHPQIVAAERDVTAARHAVEEARAALLPDVDLAGTFSYRDNPSTLSDWSRSADVRLSVSIPLYQGGAEYARVREAKQRLAESQRRLDSATRAVRKLVKEAWERLLAARESIRAFEVQVKANRIALKGVQEENLVGTRTVLDVLDAEQELFDSRVDLVRARRDHAVASYQLRSAMGTLTAADLGLEVKLYDPERHYRNVRTRLFGLE